MLTEVKKVSSQLESNIGSFQVSGQNLYSFKAHKDDFQLQTSDESESYTLFVQFKFCIDLDRTLKRSEEFQQVKQFFEIMIKQVRRSKISN